MYNKEKMVLLLLFLCLLPGCWQTTETQHKGASLYVINVLSKTLYDECHIQGSISVPFQQVAKWAEEGIDKNAEIVVYCANYACTASAFAAQQLIDSGFSHVWAYEAGMHDWYANGLPSECSVESGYLSKDNIQPEEDDGGVPVLSTQELYKKMIKHGILPAE